MAAFHASAAALTEKINALLPQTQCTRCGYPACRPYAEAIACSNAPINRCPPGGHQGIRALAALLNRPELPLDPECGNEGPRQVAIIDEPQCIGCTKCIVACPVDAIIGGPKLMHSVLASQCTGCELCVDPCPVDCIRFAVSEEPWNRQLAQAARHRFEQRSKRIGNAGTAATDDDKPLHNPEQNAGADNINKASHKQKMIAQAMRRAASRRKTRQ